MPIIVKLKERPVPVGKYLAIIVAVTELPGRRVELGFELHRTRGVIKNEKGHPVVLAVEYEAVATEDKPLGAFMRGLLGQTDELLPHEFDIALLVGSKCRLVVLNESSSGVTVEAMPPGSSDPDIVNVTELSIRVLDKFGQVGFNDLSDQTTGHVGVGTDARGWTTRDWQDFYGAIDNAILLISDRYRSRIMKSLQVVGGSKLEGSTHGP